jgi:hypothetical protein
MFESIEVAITRILRIQKEEPKGNPSFIYSRASKGGEVGLLGSGSVRVECFG